MLLISVAPSPADILSSVWLPSLVLLAVAALASSRAEDERSLIGKWRKVTVATCAQTYPDEIEFLAAIYRARKGSTQRFIVWDAGGYQVTHPDRVKIETATDEQVDYSFSISGDVLRFVDREGCQFEYRRIAP